MYAHANITNSSIFYPVFTDSVRSAHWSTTMHVPEDVIDRVWSGSAVKNLQSGDTTSFWVLLLQNGCWHGLSARMLSPPQCELVSFLNRPWGLKYAISSGKMNRAAMSPCWLYTESNHYVQRGILSQKNESSSDKQWWQKLYHTHLLSALKFDISKLCG